MEDLVFGEAGGVEDQGVGRGCEGRRCARTIAAVAFTQLFHDPKAPENLSGLRVVAAFPGGSPDIEESARELPKWTDGIKKMGRELLRFFKTDATTKGWFGKVAK